MATHTYISVASGYGGLDLGVERGSSGLTQPVLYIEREAPAAAVLAARMDEEKLPPAPIWSDLRCIRLDGWRGIVDGIVSGIPCQPYSNAGRKGGESDERDLWPDLLGLINPVRPGWVFIENVAGAKDAYLERWGPELSFWGYRSRGAVVRACCLGATHQRSRLFILATNAAGVGRQEPWDGRPYSDNGEEDRQWETSDAVNALRRGTVPVVCREHDGATSRLDIRREDRLKMLGNGVCPQQAEYAWRQLWGGRIETIPDQAYVSQEAGAD